MTDICRKTSVAESAMARAWQAAAKDLAIEFVSPFSFSDSSGKQFECAGLLPHFGGPKGTLITSRFDFLSDEEWDAFDLAEEEQGYYGSGLNPNFYEKYDREHFAETLNDWGWFGAEDDIPPWFAGALNRHGGRLDAGGVTNE